jgi:hypothetical protein
MAFPGFYQPEPLDIWPLEVRILDSGDFYGCVVSGIRCNTCSAGSSSSRSGSVEWGLLTTEWTGTGRDKVPVAVCIPPPGHSQR